MTDLALPEWPRPHGSSPGERSPPAASSSRRWPGSTSATATLNAFSRVLVDEAIAEAEARDARWRPAARSGRCTAYRSRSRRRSTSPARHHVRRRGQLDPGRRRRRGGPAAAARPARSSSARPRCRSSARSRSPSPSRAASPATRGTASRTPGGSSGGTAVAVSAGMVPVGIGGDGGGSIRIPSASCGLFGLKPQRGRVTTAPHPHLWWALGTAGPLTRSVLDSALVYDAIRGNVEGDLYTAGGDEPFVDAVGRDPGRLRIGWTTKPVTLGVRPDPVHVQAVRDTARAARPTSATTSARSTRATPTRPRRSCRSSSPASAPRPTWSSTTTGSSGVPARPTGSAPGSPRGSSSGRSARPRRSPRRPTGSSTRSTCCSPRRSRTGRRRSAASTASAPCAPRCASMPSIAYAALWNVAGNPAASVPCGVAADGLPVAVQLVGRTDDEATLFSLSAQLEQARPWPLLAGERRDARRSRSST